MIAVGNYNFFVSYEVTEFLFAKKPDPKNKFTYMSAGF